MHFPSLHVNILASQVVCLHPTSSDPSAQSFSPSQFHSFGIHKPLAQAKKSDEHVLFSKMDEITRKEDKNKARAVLKVRTTQFSYMRSIYWHSWSKRKHKT
jgi:hypothetical protein